MAVITSKRSSLFTESLIREMTRALRVRGGQPGVNLAHGFPDFPAPDPMKEAACRAIRGDISQYAITWGAESLRQAIAAKTGRHYGVTPDPEREITVTCGATEAMMAAMLAMVDPGDEVIIFEPFYENYGPEVLLSCAVPRFIQLREPYWNFDPQELAAAFNDKTRAIIINTPHNPTGKVFSRAELNFIASLCQHWNVVAITDEVFEHIVYSGLHTRMADIPGMADRTITISGLSKTYSATGWRIGWLIAPPQATSAIRRVHDSLTMGAPAPLQEGAAHALSFSAPYYAELEVAYTEKRDFLLDVVKDIGFEAYAPQGAYYILADAAVLMRETGHENDISFARWMVNEVGIAAMPGSSFYKSNENGHTKIRFCFCKQLKTLSLASELFYHGFGQTGVLKENKR